MKIVELHIYGFGQLNNFTIKNLADFQVFFGENEAGKSTIMAFIHAVFFGFPTKQQSAELRYEPKHDTKYGGKIRIHHNELGIVTIERIKGKAAGDVTVSLEDGTVGDEELLSRVLSKIDKTLFQAIFSFNLQGLQNIHQMKGEELGKFLFSAGTLGTDKLMSAESELQRELENRFKPNGKKPALNEKLKSLHELNSELKKAAAKNQQYETLVSDRNKLLQEMERIHSQLIQTKDKLDKLNEWKKIAPLVKEEKWTKTELEKLREITFPLKGLERLDKLNQVILPYDAQIISLEERIEQIKKEMKIVNSNEKILKDEAAILSALEQVPIYEQLTLEKQQALFKLQELEEKTSVINEKLHLPLSEEEIIAINTNIYMKNQVEEISRKCQSLKDVKRELEGKFHEEKSILEGIEDQVRFAENQVISEHERGKLEKIISEEKNKASLEVNLKILKEKKELYQNTNERERKTIEKLIRQKQIQFYTLEFILIALALYGFFTQQWSLLIVGILSGLAIVILLGKNLRGEKEKEDRQSLNQLIGKEQEIKRELESYDHINFTLLHEQLKMDNQRREQLQLLKMKLEQQHVLYEKVITKFEEFEQHSAENKVSLLKISNELKLPADIANSFLLEAFQLIEQYKLVIREKQQISSRIEEMSLQLERIKGNLEYFDGKYLAGQGLEVQRIVYLLRTKLKEELEKQIKSEEKKAKLLDLEADIQQLKREQQHVKEECAKLLEEANVKSEEEFYQLGSKAEGKVKLCERLNDLSKQLQYTIIKANEWDEYLAIHNVDEVIQQAKELLQELADQLVMLQEKNASLKYDIQQLEEGGIYAELLHKFKHKRYLLEEEAKEWAVYRLAQEILSRTVEKYKTVYLPNMLAKAEEYLYFLTEGNYHKIHLQKSGTGFLIERKDHTLFEANELSQATTEQVYVSIRLSLATTLYEKYHFPIIIDDSFVNFDAKRTGKIMELLKRLEQNQILFFTCHRHLLPYFEPENILSLNKTEVEVPS
ncbi:MAG: AAA family ATPase [Neobacillus sp.]